MDADSDEAVPAPGDVMTPEDDIKGRNDTVRGECLDHFLIFGERHLSHLLREFQIHYSAERFHQGLGGKLIAPPAPPENDNGAIRCRSRLGGVLNFHSRVGA